VLQVDYLQEINSNHLESYYIVLNNTNHLKSYYIIQVPNTAADTRRQGPDNLCSHTTKLTTSM